MKKRDYEYSKKSDRKKGSKGKGNKHSPSFHNHQQNNSQNNNNGGMRVPSADFEVVLKWVPIEAVRVSGAENRAIYEEYCEQRARMLKETVYNPDGTENKEGIARLRQAGLSDKDIFETVGQKGQTPNGFNYHHLYPRAVSGALEEGPVQFGNETLTTIHDWRSMMVLSNNPPGHNIHENVHNAIDERNGRIPDQKGMRGTYYVPIALTAEEYELYKTNPKALKEELLIVSSRGYRTVDQRENVSVQEKEQSKKKTDWKKTKKNSKPMETADIAKIKAARDGR